MEFYEDNNKDQANEIQKNLKHECDEELSPIQPSRGG